MNTMSTSTGLIDSLIPEPLQSTYKTAAAWLNRTIQVISTIPSRLKSNPQQAMAVFFSANLIFLYFINWAADVGDDRAKNVPKVQSTGDIRVNQFLTTVVIVGGLAAVSNIALSIILRYPLDPAVVLAISAGHIACRIILNTFFPYG